MAKEFHRQRVFGPSRRDLRGMGHSPLHRQRGLKGSTLGPANEGRRLSAEERAAVEARMREEGKFNGK